MIDKVERNIKYKKFDKEKDYDVDFLLSAYNDKNRQRIIEYLKNRKEGTERENTVDNILKHLIDTFYDGKKEISRKTICEHLRILEKARLILKVTTTIDTSKPNDIYFMGENQIKRIDRIDEILKRPISELDKEELKSIINLLKEDEVMAISKRFMENVPDGGWMDICLPGEFARFVTGWSIYIEGYRKMKERGIKIRVITEFTIDNIEYCLKMIRDDMIDGIRHLKHIRCGFAVSDNQYMAAFLSDDIQNNVSKFMTNVTYSDEKTTIEYGQALFDTYWENALPIFNN